MKLDTIGIRFNMSELDKALFGISSEEAANKITEEDKILYESSQDIVLWAESTLMDIDNPDDPLKLRYYQKEMLHYQPLPEMKGVDGRPIVPQRMKVYRCGRQIGKTVALVIEALFLALILF